MQHSSDNGNSNADNNLPGMHSPLLESYDSGGGLLFYKASPKTILHQFTTFLC